MQVVTLGLVGNPNCGKSTLFNMLTGACQKVGNWPGVTVECKTGKLTLPKQQINVVDLPGIYQLSIAPNTHPVDAQIATNYILSRQANFIVNIIDASHLEKHLYLTLQLLTMNIPVIVAVNMMDIANRRHIQLNLKLLQKRLGCPVIGLVASRGKGINELKEAIANFHFDKYSPGHPLTYPPSIGRTLGQISQEMGLKLPEFSFCSEWLSLQLLQESSDSSNPLLNQVKDIILPHKTKLEQEFNEEIDIVIADIFFTNAHHIAEAVVAKKQTGKPTLTEGIDKIVLNRFLGIPIFLLVMYLMFLFTINLGGAFQDFFDMSSHAFFVTGTTQLLKMIHAPTWVVAILAGGLGRGLNTTITFIPVIGGMFFFLAFLESSGYMARATFVIDRFMRMVGLPGKAFVPMIVGFGCNVPAILAARTLEDPRDRILTVLMTPFMSCGARLAIFAVFTTAFFPSGGQNVVFLLYLIGILAAFFTGFLLRRTVLKGNLSPLVLELPAYHLPTLQTLFLSSWQRLKSFLFRAGKLIIPICMLIGVLNTINTDGTLNQRESSAHSLLSSIGRIITPIFNPMGINNNNWPATVGLVTGVLAKEVVVATLNTLYTQEAQLQGVPSSQGGAIAELKEALISVPTNLAGLKYSVLNPIRASAPGNTVNHGVYGVMYEQFGSKSAAFAYLLFVLLYFPCVSATAVMAKELTKQWALFSVVWSTSLAYATATLFYQVGTFSLHPVSSLLWVTGISAAFLAASLIMRKYSGNHAVTAKKLNVC